MYQSAAIIKLCVVYSVISVLKPLRQLQTVADLLAAEK